MTIWDRLIQLQDAIVSHLDVHHAPSSEPGMDQFNQNGWVNRTWSDGIIRRAHVDVVDARSTRGLWMMHVCVFPHTDNSSPIYGLDVIAGQNKVTGFFNDYSPTADAQHPMVSDWIDWSSSVVPSKPRELPEWARAIFSAGMVAAGNIRDIQELDQLCDFSYENFVHYLKEITKHSNTIDHQLGAAAQNRYASYQKQNPHTPKTMTALGLDPESVKSFVEEHLFPTV
jgi:hypothetical protein